MPYFGQYHDARGIRDHIAGRWGGAGDDTLTGGDSSDLLFGDVGADSLSGGTPIAAIFPAADERPELTGFVATARLCLVLQPVWCLRLWRTKSVSWK